MSLIKSVNSKNLSKIQINMEKKMKNEISIMRDIHLKHRRKQLIKLLQKDEEHYNKRLNCRGREIYYN
ncbi:hypothetical protein A3Q56_04073 [Intoshia linei]|uniref:Uncharacterized protein n=1 Tax=Intoshia linei TaxID=1819745 RepID=A0A177B1P4_9BILA|nr:hypothetical protein A3Q56_04073 [Intoshia linei]